MDTDPDLTVIDQELRDVEAALSRLDEGTYWTDERTGRPLDEALLAEQPTIRTAIADQLPLETSTPEHEDSAHEPPASHEGRW